MRLPRATACGSVLPSSNALTTPTAKPSPAPTVSTTFATGWPAIDRGIVGGAEIRALRAKLDDHAARAPIEIELRDIVRLRVAGQDLAFADAGQHPVGQRGERVQPFDHRGARGPQRRAQVRIEGNRLAGGTHFAARDGTRVRASLPRWRAPRPSDADDARAARNPPRSRPATDGSPPSPCGNIRPQDRCRRRFSISAGSRSDSARRCVTQRWSMPSFVNVSRTYWPNESLPTRLIQPTLKPSRDRPIATFRSAPATRFVNCPTPASGPVSAATNMAMASP